ncbi:Transposase IS66 family protein [Gemmata obscuriglobus]|uniref:IS66-like element ISGob3 family transposase n=1 Tax=Gemmata obscuriglobus TaxID=114 RepID=A0A2Z3GYH6_9BACT|nr:IS66-like element ISGob3 family transposase [Gemmata obscuriglobus]AWM38606.1 IS66-like element ISGob3 family transposase [Gemmata obscuriglobus]AWM38823.1 IS66-like element ISGob3 family transposase [Gemmata obscuriglobus]QEG28182.1 Transposase IS66 family protein [Gemmata obscuriglobus]QEG28436.1 Transposase IS66 family protein [Gemmata obscuriglobus]VTS05900.1 Transposase IS66 family OS=Singulisphaera acidiphila (strain ATCC BAA-1392 / DSM 18658 / VKM B-2454 / MOB10) GN=Sinac_6249 PE=4 S
MTSVPQPPELPSDLPPAVVAYIRALEATVAQLQATVAALQVTVADLQTRLNQNSSNSSKPPSSDGPQVKPAPPKSPSGKRRGGQSGHPKAERTVLPPDTVHTLKPDTCRGCACPLTGDDPNPSIHQVHEIPVVRPQVTEYRCHRLRCPHCGAVTTAPVPADAAPGYGPRVQAVAAMLTGSCRLGKRVVSQLFDDLFGLPIRPATVCKLQHTTAAALAPVAEAALAYTRGHPANVDETGWTQGRQRAWLWVAVSTSVVAFLIRATRGRSAFDDLRDGSAQVHTTDRYPVYTHLPVHRRQVCWAHLRRDFQAMIDRGNDGSPIGAALLACSDELFGHWFRVRDGTLARSTFARVYARAVRARFRTHLGYGGRCGCPKTGAVCRELLAVEPALWTFARVGGVEPTNNAAERALRHAVCWRKTSYGTDSERGSRFVERILTVLASCRRQGRNVLAFLTDAVTAHRTGAKPPTLIPVPAQQPPMMNPTFAGC